MDDNPVICYCYEVGYSRVRDATHEAYASLNTAILDGMLPMDDRKIHMKYLMAYIGQETQAGISCGTCKFERDPSIEDVILEYYPEFKED